MAYAQFRYHWEWWLAASPDALWPALSDTNRFNRDTGVPAVEEETSSGAGDGRRRLRARRFGLAIEWLEEPFEWVRPHTFSVTRRYRRGPLAEMRVRATLTPLPAGGTHLRYEIAARPRTLLGLAAIPVQIGLVNRRAFDRAIRAYDRAALTAERAASPPALSLLLAPSLTPVTLAPMGEARLHRLEETLRGMGAEPDLLTRLVAFLRTAGDLAVAKIRPYALADAWGAPRRDVLALCLWATRAGLLMFRWEVLCPLCRGSEEGSESLRDLHLGTHCASCNIDYSANFDQQVELTFRPTASIRPVDVGEFCVGGPQVTPHIVAQQRLAAGESRTIALPLEGGRYRVRSAQLRGGRLLRVDDGGAAHVTLRAEQPWPDDEVIVDSGPTIVLENPLAEEQRFILERMAWSDDAATAAEVIRLQLFRDLFAREALRPGEEIAVGSLTVVFTDLRDSTRLYREIGDATAFGHVVSHFDVLRTAIAGHDGLLVKTIGDAVMAVFDRPAAALRAILAAQEALRTGTEGRRPLVLKAGLHFGPCIAVTLNDRLDYFGSTVNAAARLEGASRGDIILSSAVRDDPEVLALLDALGERVTLTPELFPLKGFDSELHGWRLALSPEATASPARP